MILLIDILLNIYSFFFKLFLYVSDVLGPVTYIKTFLNICFFAGLLFFNTITPLVKLFKLYTSITTNTINRPRCIQPPDTNIHRVILRIFAFCTIKPFKFIGITAF